MKTSLQLRGLPPCVKKKEKYQIGCSKHKWPDSPTETSRQRHPDRDIPTETSRQKHPDRDFPIDDFTDKLKRSENWSIIYSEKIFCRLSLCRLNLLIEWKIFCYQRLRYDFFSFTLTEILINSMLLVFLDREYKETHLWLS